MTEPSKFTAAAEDPVESPRLPSPTSPPTGVQRNASVEDPGSPCEPTTTVPSPLIALAETEPVAWSGAI